MRIDRIIPNFYYAVSLSVFFLKNIDNKLSLAKKMPQLLGKTGKLIILLNKKYKFIVRDMYDLLALKEVYSDEIYKPLFNNLAQNTTFIDIGTYIGDVVIYAQKFKKISWIIALEPLPENILATYQNIKLNKIRNVTLIKRAISQKEGTKDFFIHKNKGQSGFFKFSSKATKIKVKTITLPQILKSIKSKNIILKSDCEGAEYDLFISLNNKYYSRIDKIIFEYHNLEKLPQILQKFKKIGYKISYKKHPVESNLGIAYAQKI